MYKSLLLAVFAVLALNSESFSQPVATVLFEGGYSLPLSDLRGDFGAIFNQWTGNGNPDTNTFYMKSGVNYGIFVRFPIKKKSNIHIIGGLGYDDFSNSASYNDSTGAADFTLKQSVLGVTLGAEYDFYSKKSKFMPFVGAEMMLSIFGGKLIIDEPTESRELKMNTTSRFGFQLGAGVDWIFHNNLGLVLGAKYTYANLFGKEFIEDKGTKYNLNDGEHTSNGVDYPEKKVRYIHFYAALAFYFGR